MKKLLLISSIIIFFNSCGDSRTQGCTDIYGVNYNSSADYDNGSCIYEVDVVFALDGNSSAYLNDDDYATEVAYYIDNDISAIGFDYWNSITGFPFAIPGITPPYCYEAGYTSFTYSWTAANNSTFYYQAIPDGGIFQWEGDVTLNKQDDCIYIPLTLAKKSEKSKIPTLENTDKKMKNSKRKVK